MQTTPTPDALTAAVKKTLTERQAKPDSVVLPSAPMVCMEFGYSGAFTYYNCTSRDYSTHVHMQAARMTEDPSMRNVWYGSETRTAEDGTQWARQIGHMVQDDFGFLVQVAA